MRSPAHTIASWSGHCIAARRSASGMVANGGVGLIIGLYSNTSGSRVKMKPWALGLGFVVAFSFGTAAAAQDYPTRPVRIIVPYGPGGVDLQVRAMAPTLARILGQ